ncbi:putative Sulfotransferase domain, P-loop containing nucleoside triphosphate hydrolase [Helianthus annuus]|nr:putative Sulfotransferase domain, P-loop containing nucleoside triphosphate hydrolase [Helianthus annuus]
MSMPIASHAFSLPSLPKYSNEGNHETTNMALIFDRYKDRLATLPKEKGWITENLYMYQGFWHQSSRRISVETVMALQGTFKAHPTDIYLATLPKSGTTWLKALVFALVNRNRYKDDRFSTHPLLVSSPHNCLPFIETEIFRNTPTYVDSHSPRLFATHIPYTSLPQSILDSGCRLVYLCRNPKDVLVSMFHFANKLRDKSRGLLTFEETFELFSKGIMPTGPYWDHVKGYHKASLEHPEKVLFLTYEDMKIDTVNNVKRLARYLGYPFTEEEEAEGAVEGIVKLCSFENLSEVNKHGNLREDIPNDTFFREGKVGDWTNHLTDEMSSILDDINKEKFYGLDITWNNPIC